jgi:4-methylaminobutanoate oxidase (formaldehyde-forming)
MFVLNDTTPGNPLLLHDEPIYYEGKIVGETTSGNYSFTYNKNLAYGYIDAKLEFDLSNSIFEIEVAKKKYKASVLKKALHDPENSFIRN